MNLRHNKYVAMPWHWATLPIDEDIDLKYGTLHHGMTGCIVDIHDEVVDKDTVRLVRRRQEVVGRIEQARFLAFGFMRDRDRLFSSYDLSCDGVVRAPMMELGKIYHSLISDFSDYVVAGNRLIEKMSDLVSSVFVSGSKERKEWRGATSVLFDGSLAYALFDQYRNEIEHGFCPINIVNYDVQGQRVGVALNLEAGLLARKSVKPIVKERLMKFRRERIRNGLTPWLSITSLSKEYDRGVCLLYLYYLLMMGGELMRRNRECSFRLGDKVNCLYWQVENDASYEEYSIDRVYPIYEAEYLKIAYLELKSTSEHLLREYPDSEEINETAAEIVRSAENQWPIRGQRRSA